MQPIGTLCRAIAHRSRRGCGSAPFVVGQLSRNLLSARDLSDETGDQALNLGRWQVVAGNAVRLAEIAADYEAAQPGARKTFRSRGGEPANYLHRGGFADPFEYSAGRITKKIAFDELGVGVPSIGLQVNPDHVDT